MLLAEDMSDEFDHDDSAELNHVKEKCDKIINYGKEHGISTDFSSLFEQAEQEPVDESYEDNDAQVYDEQAHNDITTKLPTIVYRKQSLFTKIKQLIFKKNNKVYFDCVFEGMVGKFPHKLSAIVEQLRNPYLQKNGNYLNRLILYGPPGNGKSTIAKKIATKAYCSIKIFSAPKIINSYLGSGPQGVTKIFEDAAAEAYYDDHQVIIFIDEIDAIAANVESEFRAEHKATLQTLWLCLDNYKNDKNLFFICATNHIDKLHPTFLDRFGANIVEISNPDKEMRMEVLTHYSKFHTIPLPQKLILDVADRTNNFSCRALEDLVTELKAIIAQQMEKETIDAHFIFDVVATMKQKVSVAKNNQQELNLEQKYLTRTSLVLNCCSLLAFVGKLIIPQKVL